MNRPPDNSRARQSSVDRRRRIAAAGIAVCLAFGALASPCAAGEIYVDNRKGDDTFDGRAREPIDVRSGPVQSIGRALRLAARGDTIVIANNGTPYYEALQLVGLRHSGVSPSHRLTIIGNGAVVSGARRVPEDAWQVAGEDLWKLTPWRKGWYGLIRDGETVPEVSVPADADELPNVPPGRWAAWRGAIYYRAPAETRPSEENFAFAYEDVGLTLYRVRHVEVRGLTFRHFRIDGVSAPALCDDVVLRDVVSTGNARAGLFLGGTADVEALECRFANNRLYPVLIRGRYAVLRATPELPAPPTFVD